MIAPPAGSAVGVSSRRRGAPSQSGKLSKVAIKRDPHTARFNGERCKPGVAHARPANARLDAKTLEDVPVSLTGFDELTVRLYEKVMAKAEGLRNRTWPLEGTSVRRDANNSAQG